jgi:hypothetical protein
VDADIQAKGQRPKAKEKGQVLLEQQKNDPAK